jgi:hypothetical protein
MRVSSLVSDAPALIARLRAAFPYEGLQPQMFGLVGSDSETLSSDGRALSLRLSQSSSGHFAPAKTMAAQGLAAA